MQMYDIILGASKYRNVLISQKESGGQEVNLSLSSWKDVKQKTKK